MESISSKAEKRDMKEILDNLKIEKSFFIVSLPFVGYMITYIYKLSYLSFFNVPNIFLEINIQDVIYTTVLITFVVLIATIFILFVVFLSSKSKKTDISDSFGKISKATIREQMLVYILLCILLAGGSFYVFDFAFIYKMIISFGVLILLSFIFLGLPYLYFPNEKSFSGALNKYYEKIFNEQLEKQKRALEISPFSLKPFFQPILFLFETPYFGYSFYILGLFILILVSYLIGGIVASEKTNFYTYNDSGQDYILAGIYNNQIVAVSVDRSNNITSDHIKLLPLDRIENFKYLYLGKMNVEKQKGN